MDKVQAKRHMREALGCLNGAQIQNLKDHTEEGTGIFCGDYWSLYVSETHGWPAVLAYSDELIKCDPYSSEPYHEHDMEQVSGIINCLGVACGGTYLASLEALNEEEIKEIIKEL